MTQQKLLKMLQQQQLGESRGVLLVVCIAAIAVFRHPQSAPQLDCALVLLQEHLALRVLPFWPTVLHSWRFLLRFRAVPKQALQQRALAAFYDDLQGVAAQCPIMELPQLSNLPCWFGPNEPWHGLPQVDVPFENNNPALTAQTQMNTAVAAGMLGRQAVNAWVRSRLTAVPHQRG